jgi:benzoyl-CoA reductase subunit B
MTTQTVDDKLKLWSEMYRMFDNAYKGFRMDSEGLGMLGTMAALRNYSGRLLDALQGKQPIVWNNLTLNTEIIYALDAVPMCIQLLPALYGFTQQLNIVMELIDYAESLGVPSDLCSVDKLSTAVMSKKLYPRPSCHIGTNAPCDSQVFASQTMLEMEPVPQFFIDVPYYKDERAIKYVAGQFKDAIPFLAQHTGKKFDIDRLRYTCDMSNRMVENLWEWAEWRKHVPVVQASRLSQMGLYINILSAGSEDGVIWSEGLKREAREKAQRGKPIINERVRGVWYQDSVAWDFFIYDWMEKQLGLTIPVDIFGYYLNQGLIDTKNVDTMCYGLARKNITVMPMARQFMYNAELFIQDFLTMVEEYQADCGIYAGHLGCKHGWAVTGLLKEACRKADIPLLVFEFDMFDPRVIGQEDLKIKMTQFVDDIVWPKKQARAARG